MKITTYNETRFFAGLPVTRRGIEVEKSAKKLRVGFIGGLPERPPISHTVLNFNEGTAVQFRVGPFAIAALFPNP